MNNMEEIKPKYVSFSQAKLLKKKEIELDTEEILFYKDEVNNIEEHQLKNRDVIYNATSINYKVDEDEYRTYHQWELVEWLIVNHGIWVYVGYRTNDLGENIFTPCGRNIPIKKEGVFEIDIIPYMPKSSPQEAYSAAFDYILKELI
jgi:hypothetical protein